MASGKDEVIMSEISGGCACRAVHYMAKGNPLFMVNCHCRDCQKSTGAAYAPLLAFSLPLVWWSGHLHFYETVGGSGRVVRRGFCPNCGNPVAIEPAVGKSIQAIYAATLDDPSLHQPTQDIFTDSAQPWDHMDPATLKAPGRMVREPKMVQPESTNCAEP